MGDTGQAGEPMRGSARKRYYGIIFVIVVALIVSPFVLYGMWSSTFPSWQSSLSSLLIGAGTTLGLALFVPVVEREIARRTGEIARQSAETAANTVAEQVHTDVAEVADRVTRVEQRLDDQLTAALAAHDAERTQALDDLASASESGNVGFQDVASALDTLTETRLVPSQRFTVPLNSPTSADRVTFDWGVSEDGVSVIGLTVLGRHVSSGRLAETPRIEWEDQSTAEILADLALAMRTAGLATEVLGEQMFIIVEKALRQLRRSWTGEETWFEGPVLEWLADDWVITHQGLVRRGHGLLLRFAAQVTFGVEVLGGPRERFPLPTGCDEDFWSIAVERTYAHLGRMQKLVSAQ
ncbi:hypothetical protein O4158_20965 [Gordonia amicalis]|uniref:hypothetical protein n=1 Tax=Gordonia amicalis TaxID=89053 RepID=UPI0022B4B2FB|nr:hypothetical protein [Gordonia amicalis]MCZ4581511.1 hypothetical protein [Gordonia amicalis]